MHDQEDTAAARPTDKVGAVLRLVASGGYADEDTDVLMDLVALARRLAAATIDDPGASAETKALARQLQAAVDEDLLRR